MSARTPVVAARLKLPEQPSHPGLVLKRYLAFGPDGSKEAQDAREQLLEAAKITLRTVAPLYRLAYQRWSDTIPANSRRLFETTSPMIIGLGGASPLETGLTLHHTYGAPLIPGTALKGLASHHCHAIWGVQANQPAFLGTPGREGDAFRIMFGRADEGGLIQFHDAWIHPDDLVKSLHDDVLTPHHPAPPEPVSDFDEPIPTTFLSVTGRFLVPVVASRALSEKWVELALALVSDALEHWGIGGKTNAGYGRLVEKPVESSASSRPRGQ